MYLIQNIVMKLNIVLIILSTIFADSLSSAQIDTIAKIKEESSIPDHDPYYVYPKETIRNYGPTCITRNILQDKNGFFWLASWEGIVRFDPKAKTDAFVNYTLKENLVKFHTFSLLEDSKGNIWFGTIGGGMYKYDPLADLKDSVSFTHFTTSDGLIGNSVTCLYEDNGGNIWVGTSSGISFLHQNQKSGKLSISNSTTKNGLTSNDINVIAQDRSGRIWIGTRGATCYKERGYYFNFSLEQNKPFENVRTIIEDGNGDVWLGGNDGLWRATQSPRATYEQTLVQITTDFTGYIYEDKKGTIWFGATKPRSREWNLYRIDLDAKVVFVHQEPGQIFGIVEDKDGSIWFGHERGICRLNFDLGPIGGAIGEYF